jgi:uncharacterized protein (UPF0147 family)
VNQLSIENLFAVDRGWRIDPDGRYDRRPGPVIPGKMTEEDIKKYGKPKCEEENAMAKMTKENLIELCGIHGFGKKAYEKIGEILGVHWHSVEVKVCEWGIRKAVEEQQSAINNHEEHVEATEIEDLTKFVEAINDAAGSINETVNKAAAEAAKQVSAKAKESVKKLTVDVDEMMEMVPDDKVNHPKHYNTGKFEVIDIIESIISSMNLTPFEGFCIGCAVKYIGRWKNKGGIEDLKKAVWYLDRIVKRSA